MFVDELVNLLVKNWRIPAPVIVHPCTYKNASLRFGGDVSFSYLQAVIPPMPFIPLMPFIPDI
ncbi:MAG: hypothetical protein OQL19_02315, partial [Gammaproteobacteria bacterium]|nr:hypothetical protein [Gammaproteobacteria bacterium]